jgi:hypothetical protein
MAQMEGSGVASSSVTAHHESLAVSAALCLGESGAANQNPVRRIGLSHGLGVTWSIS